jgi:hypothetical protein
MFVKWGIHFFVAERKPYVLGIKVSQRLLGWGCKGFELKVEWCQLPERDTCYSEGRGIEEEILSLNLCSFNS